MIFFWIGFVLLCAALGGVGIAILIAAGISFKVYKVLMGNLK